MGEQQCIKPRSKQNEGLPVPESHVSQYVNILGLLAEATIKESFNCCRCCFFPHFLLCFCYFHFLMCSSTRADFTNAGPAHGTHEGSSRSTTQVSSRLWGREGVELLPPHALHCSLSIPTHLGTGAHHTSSSVFPDSLHPLFKAAAGVCCCGEVLYLL